MKKQIEELAVSFNEMIELLNQAIRRRSTEEECEQRIIYLDDC
jgi:predicted HTH domain antitoxin